MAGTNKQNEREMQMKKALCLIAALALGGMAPAASAADYDSYATPGPLSESAIRMIQMRLNQNGFDAGTPDGIWGRNTASAVAAFQDSRGLSVTGTLNMRTLQALSSTSSNTTYGQANGTNRSRYGSNEYGTNDEYNSGRDNDQYGEDNGGARYRGTHHYRSNTRYGSQPYDENGRYRHNNSGYSNDDQYGRDQDNDNGMYDQNDDDNDYNQPHEE
jgi:peptidoglycan hydrolase-like protein with peptidoglycan-binding domain